MANAADVLVLVEDAIEDGYGPVLSVFIADPVECGGVDAAVTRACLDGKVPHSKVRVARYGDLTAQGFGVALDTSDGQPDCHHHIVFPESPTIVNLETFIDLFGEPIPNPAKETKP